MLLTPTELERLTIFTVAEMARKRKAKGLKLNHPETVAYISDEILEGAREGRSVAELISFGSTLLSTEDVMPGVVDLLPIIQVEGLFPDGTKLVTVHDPIRPGKSKEKSVEQDYAIPGELFPEEGTVEINPGRRTLSMKIVNTGDRPVQIGSHYHIFEANRALDFDREKAFGMRLDIPAGTAVRFEPGESKKVTLTEFGGTSELQGLNGLTNGSSRSEEVRKQAILRAKKRGFKGA